jgi:multidrug efflux pump subunit AcrA (membrane-fusion protein)
MKKRNILIFISLLITACHTNQDETGEKEQKPKTQVQVTTIRRGNISDDLVLSATSVYLRRNSVTSSIPGFITRVNVKLGDRVRKGQVLYSLESKERKALGQDISKIDPSLQGFGLIDVKAPASGIVTTFDKQQTGEYVLEGTALCTIAESHDLAFEVNVPYEFSAIVKPGKQCLITLPDNSTHKATITTPLTTMNITAQTQTLLAKPEESLFLPENLLAKVQVSRTGTGEHQVLPKSCVLSDEMMKSFWVMKLQNDSTAIKVPVQTGNKNSREIEIISPVFQSGERIISSGNYGLTDTASIRIVKN